MPSKLIKARYFRGYRRIESPPRDCKFAENYRPEAVVYDLLVLLVSASLWRTKTCPIP
jgi:hypothetical protein